MMWKFVLDLKIVFLAAVANCVDAVDAAPVAVVAAEQVCFGVAF